MKVRRAKDIFLEVILMVVKIFLIFLKVEKY